MIKTQFGTMVKSIRTDNGGEFLGKNFQDMLRNQGIIHQKTEPYTPQHNGVVERKHKHLLQLARSLMVEASMPKRFWPYSLLMATRIVNRLPTVILRWKSPYEVLYKKTTRIYIPQNLWLLAYATNTIPHKRKFENRAHKCVFIGYSPGQKAFKLYNLDTRETMVSRDVVFYEKIFPFRCKSSKNLGEDSVPLPVISSNLPEDTEGHKEIIRAEHNNDNDPDNDTEEENIENIPVQRQSTRQRRTPTWLEDYIVNTSLEKTPRNKTKPQYTPKTYPYTTSDDFDVIYISLLMCPLL